MPLHDDTCCEDIVKAKKDIEALQGQFQDIQDILKEINEKLQDRLPVWATVAFTLMGTIIGVLATQAVRGG